MAFGIDFVAAIVALKKKNGQTRLKALQKHLKQKPPSQAKLYQYPVQRLLLLLFIAAIVGSLEWINQEAKTELKFQIVKSRPQLILQEPVLNSIYFVPHKYTNTTVSHLQLQAQITRKITRLRLTLNCIQCCFGLAFLSLLLTLKLKVVSLRRGQAFIKVVTYHYLGFIAQKGSYNVKQGDRIGICEMGENRFTNTNYYYEVKILGKQGKQYSVIEKSCMFDARTATIRLADQLGIKYSTKIRKPSKSLSESSDFQ